MLRSTKYVRLAPIPFGDDHWIETSRLFGCDTKADGFRLDEPPSNDANPSQGTYALRENDACKWLAYSLRKAGKACLPGVILRGVNGSPFLRTLTDEEKPSVLFHIGLIHRLFGLINWRLTGRPLPRYCRRDETSKPPSNDTARRHDSRTSRTPTSL